MHFRLLPTTIRKEVSFEEGVLVQRLFFAASVSTADESYDQSELADGRKIDSLPCTIFLSASASNELEGFLLFKSKYISTEQAVPSSPDRLHIEARLPAPFLRELWGAFEDGARVVLFGKIVGIASKYAHSLSPYQWDISEAQNHAKDLKSLSFTTLKQIVAVTDPMFSTATSTDFARDLRTARDFTVSVRKKIVERHEPYGQMRRLCFKAIEQSEVEAVAQGLSQNETETLAEDAVALIDDAYAAVRSHQSKVNEVDPTRLWRHQDLLQVLVEGRKAVEHWEVGKDQLIEIARGLIDRPWLRIDEFEWAIVDALTFREVFEFGESVKEFASSFLETWSSAAADGSWKQLLWQRFKAHPISWLVSGILAAGMWLKWTYIYKHSDLLSICVITCAFALPIFLLIGLPFGKKGKRLRKQQLMQIWAKMGTAYSTLKQGELLSPNQIRAALLAAQDNGAF